MGPKKNVQPSYNMFNKSCVLTYAYQVLTAQYTKQGKKVCQLFQTVVS